MLKAVDLYCGAGGTTTGAHMSGLVEVVLAVNHWRTAIYTHQNNHPGTRHLCARLERVDPREFRGLKIDLVMASPECTGHSNARGGRPTSDQRRAGGNEVLQWVFALRPKWLVVENVREWLDWGPISESTGRPLKARKGEYFRKWVADLEGAGYRVEWRLLNAADYGEATSRTRLFVIARRGRKSIPWPEPTHPRENWRPAAEIIDWSLPFPSIFSRRKPLCDNTVARIDIGLHKFVEPFVVHLRGASTVGDTGDPLSTVTGSGAHHGVALPFTVQYHNGPDGENRTTSIEQPLPTLDTQNRHAVAVPFLTPNFSERNGQLPRTHDVAEPLPTVTSHGAGGVAVPFVLNHRGVHCKPGEPAPRSPNDPMPTIVAGNGGRCHYVVSPFMLPRVGFYDRDLAQKRVRSLDQPCPVITANHGPGHLVAPFILNHRGDSSRDVVSPAPTLLADPGSQHHIAAPFIVDSNHKGDQGRTHSISDPLKTVTARNGKGLALPFLTNYFGNGQADPISEPLSTLTTKPRHGVAAPMFGDPAEREAMLDAYAKRSPAYKRLVTSMRDLSVWDIGYRMLIVRELLAAQGFPDGYKLHGTVEEMTMQVGNAVCPRVAKAICEAIAV
jgi:DNA (cytosine-5)-methyltransferase 1